MDSLNLLIGCPVKDREWIIDKWIWYVDQAVQEMDQPVNYKFIFIGAYADNTILKVLPLASMDHAILLDSGEKAEVYVRAWSKPKYEHMANIRNQLLETVRKLAPDYFVSLDSDILPHPLSLKNMIETQKNTGAKAVGGKAFLSKGFNCPTYGIWGNRFTRDHFRRTNNEGILAVDVLMAYKLMTPAAYSQDYAAHPTGEDAGWSKNFQRGDLYWDGRVTSKHVMSHYDMGNIDERCGY